MHTEEEYSKDKKFGWFYIEDCLCDSCLACCKEIYRFDKSKKLIMQLPAFYKPDNWEEQVGIEYLEDVHNSLIERYNETVSKYAALGLIDEQLASIN